MKKRMAVWVVVLPLLALFSASLVGSALAARLSVQARAGDVVPAGGKPGKLVLVDTGQGSLVGDYFGLKSSTRVCWVSERTLALLAAKYETSVSTVTVDSRGSFELVTVKDADAGHIRQIVNQNPCTLVHNNRTYFLPLDAHTS